MRDTLQLAADLIVIGGHRFLLCGGVWGCFLFLGVISQFFFSRSATRRSPGAALLGLHPPPVVGLGVGSSEPMAMKEVGNRG